MLTVKEIARSAARLATEIRNSADHAKGYTVREWIDSLTQEELKEQYAKALLIIHNLSFHG